MIQHNEACIDRFAMVDLLLLTLMNDGVTQI
jgi:hypothetical protein